MENVNIPKELALAILHALGHAPAVQVAEIYVALNNCVKYQTQPQPIEERINEDLTEV